MQSANPEVGTIQPVQEVGDACRRASIPLLVDAAARLDDEQVCRSIVKALPPRLDPCRMLRTENQDGEMKANEDIHDFIG